MTNITPYQIIEIIVSLFIFWVGIYQLSQNIKAYFSWIIFFFFLIVSFLVITEPIILQSPDFKTFQFWQKITNWPLFLMPALLLHIAIFTSNTVNKLKPYLISAYAFSLFFTLADVGGLVIKEGVVRFDDYKRIDSFAANIFMIPFVIYCVICFSLAIYHFNIAKRAQKNNKFNYPIIGSTILLITACLTGASYYLNITSAQLILSVGLPSGVLFFVYFTLSYYQLINHERNIFDRGFFYRTVGMFIVVTGYITVFLVGRRQINFDDFIFLVFLNLLIIISHTAYEWINTFINDLLYNPSSGLSIVSDQEVGNVIRNYSSPECLEGCSLLRLNLLKNKSITIEPPVDRLRVILKDVVEYFKTDEQSSRRTKRNLKYHLLRMIAYDQAEEGQMLWELGFDEYPVKILSRENQLRKPLFKIESPSDYSYTSRNAFLALKREAIHEVAWRISYLEKQAQKKKF